MSREKYDAQSANNSTGKQLINSYNDIGLRSILSRVKDKVCDLLFINNQDGREESDSGKQNFINLSITSNESQYSSNSSNLFPKYSNLKNNSILDKLHINPSYINENQHIYDAPSYLNRKPSSHFEMNLNNYQSEHNDNNSTGRKSHLNRRFSLDSSNGKARNNFTNFKNSENFQNFKNSENFPKVKKTHPLLKIATHITNKKFNIDKQSEFTGNFGNIHTSQTSQLSQRSAFKLLNDTKTINMQNKKFLNYNDFNELLKGRNIIRPKPIYSQLKNKRAREANEAYDIKSHDAMSIVDNQSHSTKKPRLEASIFSSVNYLNKIKSQQRDDVSMRSVNSSLNRDNYNNNSMVSMQSNHRQNKSVLSARSNYQSKTIDEIRREIEEKRSSHRNMFEEMHRRYEKRHDREKEMSYEERKRVLANYYKDRREAAEKTDCLPGKHVRFEAVDFDVTRDRNFSLSKSQINIEASPRNKPVVIEKKEEINIINIASMNKLDNTSDNAHVNINTSTTTNSLFNFGAPSTLEKPENKDKEKEKISSNGFTSAFNTTASSKLFNPPPKNDENKNINISPGINTSNLSNMSNLFTKPIEGLKSSTTANAPAFTATNSLTEKKEKQDKETADQAENKKPALFSPFNAPTATNTGNSSFANFNLTNSTPKDSTNTSPLFTINSNTTNLNNINAPTNKLFEQPPSLTPRQDSSATVETKPSLFSGEITAGLTPVYKLDDSSKSNEKAESKVSNLITPSTTNTTNINNTTETNASTSFLGISSIKKDKTKEEVKLTETKTEMKPLFGNITPVSDSNKKEATVTQSTTNTEPAKAALFTGNNLFASNTSNLFSLNKTPEQTAVNQEQKKEIISPFSNKAVSTVNTTTNLDTTKTEAKPEDINKPSQSLFPTGSLFSNTPLSATALTNTSSSTSTLITETKQSFPSSSPGLFPSNINNSVTPNPLLNTNPIPSSLNDSTNPAKSSTSLCNNSNPFLAVSNTNQNAKTNLFSSPVKTNTQSEPSSFPSNSNSFVPKNSMNQQNKNRDMFGAFTPNFGATMNNTANNNANNNVNTNNPLSGLTFSHGTSNNTAMNNDGDMAISPVTSPKPAYKKDGGLFNTSNIAPIGNLFGLNSGNNVNNTVNNTANNANSKNSNFNFNSNFNNLVSGSLGSMQPTNLFTNTAFPSQQTGGFGFGLANQNTNPNTGNNATNPFAVNSSNPTPNFFNPNGQTAQGGLFGNNTTSMNSNSNPPAFGQSSQLFGGSTGGLKFSLGKKDK